MILGPKILPEIYPFLKEIMNKRGVILSLTMHLPGSIPINQTSISYKIP